MENIQRYIKYIKTKELRAIKIINLEYIKRDLDNYSQDIEKEFSEEIKRIREEVKKMKI